MAQESTFETFVPTVVERSPCHKHKAGQGDPCWWIVTSAGRVVDGICNKRARKAGFVGKINPKSLSMFGQPKKR